MQPHQSLESKHPHTPPPGLQDVSRVLETRKPSTRDGQKKYYTKSLLVLQFGTPLLKLCKFGLFSYLPTYISVGIWSSIIFHAWKLQIPLFFLCGTIFANKREHFSSYSRNLFFAQKKRKLPLTLSLMAREKTAISSSSPPFAPCIQM